MWFVFGLILRLSLIVICIVCSECSGLLVSVCLEIICMSCWVRFLWLLCGFRSLLLVSGLVIVLIVKLCVVRLVLMLLLCSVMRLVC